MTSHSPFDKYVLLQFKSGLREQHRELQQQLIENAKEIRELAATGPRDAVDVSCFNSSTESMCARTSHIHYRLRLVEMALERIRGGSFGACVVCEGAIGLKRLQALPCASHCIQCQERFEHSALDESVISLQASLPDGG